MKIKSLLAAVSMVALSATAANAIVVTENSGAFSAPLALELNLAANPVAGTVIVAISPDGNGFYNQGVQHNVVVNLPAGMTFAGAVPNGALTGNGGGAIGNIFTGGAAGGSSVTFQIAPLSNNTNTFFATIPVNVSSCLAEGSGIQAIVSTAGGFVNNDVDGDNTGSVAMSGFGGCASAWDGVVNGTTASGTDTFVALANPTYTTIGGDAVLGSITYAIDPAVAVSSTGTALALSDLAPAAVVSTITLAGNPATVATPPSNGAVLSATNGTLAGGPVVWTLTQTAAEAVAGAVISVAAGTAVLPNLQPTVTTATSNFVAANGFIASEAGATGNLEFIQREGQGFGVFDWNSGPVGAQTISVYRITGLEPGVPVTYTATLYNSLANGTLPPATVTGDASGEAVLVSTTLPGIPATVSRYDLGLNFETARTLDVDRLLSRGGVVTNFGGGANGNDVSLQGSPSVDADN